MAPRKPPRPRGGNSQILPPTKVTLSLDSHPVSLLWAHQLRREHQLLLDKIEGIAADNEKHEARTSELASKAAKTAIDHLDKQNETLQQSFEELKKHLRDQDERFGVFEVRLKSYEAEGVDLNSIQENLTALEERVRTHTTDVHGIIDDFASKDAVLALESRISDIDKQLIRLLSLDNILVKDSMEGHEMLSEHDGTLTDPCKCNN